MTKFQQKERDPHKVKVQLNVKVTWEFREHLTRLAEQNGVSINHLVNNALEASFPMRKGYPGYDAITITKP